MVGQYQGGHERVQDDGRHGTESKCVAREDKGRPIATRRRPLGEKEVRILEWTTSLDSSITLFVREDVHVFVREDAHVTSNVITYHFSA